MPISEELQRRIASFTSSAVDPTKGVISNREMELFQQASPSSGQISDQEEQILQGAEIEHGKPFSEEERELALLQIEQMNQMSQAPYYPQAQQLAGLGTLPDDQLIHAEIGDVVVPPDLIEEDPELEAMLEQKFIDANIDPESRMVGSPKGIRSLETGMQEMLNLGKFSKFLERGFKNVVRPVAKVAQFIPGPHQGVASLIAKSGTVYDVAKGRANPLSLLSVMGPLRTGPSITDSIKNIKGLSTAAGGSGSFLSGLVQAAKQTPSALASGIGSLVTSPIDTIKNFFKSRNPDDYVQDESGNWVNKFTGEGLPKGVADAADMMSRSGSGIQALTKGLQGSLFGTAGMMSALTPVEDTSGKIVGYEDAAGNIFDVNIAKELKDSGFTLNNLGQLIPPIGGSQQQSGSLLQRAGSGIAGLLGLGGSNVGGGGIGGLLGLGLAGGLAGTLGKLAYDETKKDTGVALSPLTTMDATGRYNIEAEIARRMGQPAPNPVEFGLLPAGTFPQLSGGKPLPAALPAAAAMAPALPAALPAAAPEITNRERREALNERQEMLPDGVTKERLKRHVSALDNEYQIYGESASAFPGMSQAANDFYSDYSSLSPSDMAEIYSANKGGGIRAFAEGGNVLKFERMNGYINGAGTETSDDVPAMLSDGEFVMTGQAVRGAGKYEMGTGAGGILTLVPSLDEDRERGTNLLYDMMNTFSNQAVPA